MVAITLDDQQAAELVDGQPFELRTPDGRRCVAFSDDAEQPVIKAGRERVPTKVLLEVAEAMERRERGESGPLLSTQEVLRRIKSGEIGRDR